jgi:hypothetical protein
MPILGTIASSITGSKLSTSSFESIATTVVGAGGVADITFSSIPSTYTHLQIRCIARGTSGSVTDNWILQLNGDTAANYSQHFLYGNGASTSASGLGANVSAPNMGLLPSNSNLANAFSATVVDILDYKNTNKYKTLRSSSGYDGNGSDGYVFLFSTNWRSNSAVTSIKVKPIASHGNFAQYSSFALYGIKGA